MSLWDRLVEHVEIRHPWGSKDAQYREALRFLCKELERYEHLLVENSPTTVQSVTKRQQIAQNTDESSDPNAD